jgi:hypothetical protein
MLAREAMYESVSSTPSRNMPAACDNRIPMSLSTTNADLSPAA